MHIFEKHFHKIGFEKKIKNDGFSTFFNCFQKKAFAKFTRMNRNNRQANRRIFLVTNYLQALEQLEQFVKECDRRTDQARKKLAETQEELSAEATVKLNKINELAEEIGNFRCLFFHVILYFIRKVSSFIFPKLEN